jgi:hypothetical protein
VGCGRLLPLWTPHAVRLCCVELSFQFCAARSKNIFKASEEEKDELKRKKEGQNVKIDLKVYTKVKINPSTKG